MNKYAYYLLMTTLFLLLVIILYMLVKNQYIINDYDCSDFSTQQEAQKVFNRSEKDVYRLDRDGDNIACEGIS